MSEHKRLGPKLDELPHLKEEMGCFIPEKRTAGLLGQLMSLDGRAIVEYFARFRFLAGRAGNQIELIARALRFR